MSYYFSRILDLDFDAAVQRTRDALKAEGFGVITEIDVRQTFRAKLDVEFRPYIILGACNPRMAFEALSIEDKVGTMLPCNVVVQELSPGRSEVAAIDPAASMQAIGNADLSAKARQVGEMLQQALDRL